MTEPKKQLPLEYYQALCAEARAMTEEYILLKTGKITKSPEDREKWNEKKEKLLAEIRRVRASL